MIILNETLEKKKNKNAIIVPLYVVLKKITTNTPSMFLWLFAKMPLARCLAESLYGVSLGLLGQLTSVMYP